MKNSLTRSDIIKMLSGLKVVNAAQAKALVDLFFDTLGGALRNGTPVQIKGFGHFEVVPTPARTVRNPRTGETHAMAAGRRVKFKASKQLLGGSEVAE